jgi:hypothetical protein
MEERMIERYMYGDVRNVNVSENKVVLGLLGHLGGMKRMQKMSRKSVSQQKQRQKQLGLKQRSTLLQ